MVVSDLKIQKLVFENINFGTVRHNWYWKSLRSTHTERKQKQIKEQSEKIKEWPTKH